MTRELRPLLRLQLLTATGLGVGYAPAVPGTFGSALGVVLFVGAHLAGGWAAVTLATLGITLGGLWSAGPTARHLGREDPGPVVVDEIAGQCVTLAFLPFTVASLAAGFVLFRILDIVKPPPARQLESLPGASGIMADDLVAGLYANLTLQVAHWSFPGLLG